MPEPISPPGGYGTKPFAVSDTSCPAKSFGSSPYSGSVVGVCSFDEECQLTGIDLYPFTRVGKPRSRVGIPMLADSTKAREIIQYLNDISAPFGTKIKFKNGRGIITL